MTAGGQNRRLWWQATSVMVVGAFTVGAVLVTGDDDLSRTPGWTLPVLVVLVAVASAFVFRVRLQSTVVGAAWTDAAILVCIVSLPSAWVPACVAVGVLLGKLLTRLSPFKSAYNAAKDALSAAAGLFVATHLGLGPPDALAQPWGLVLVALVVTVTEHVIGVPVLALASHTPWRRILFTNADIKAAFFVGKVSVALLTLWLNAIDPRLLAVVPPVALCMRLLYAGRVKARADIAAWQQLAATTEGLNATDLRAVLDTAVVSAAKLFAADGAEVILRDAPDGPILVRGTAEGVAWSGDPGRAPAASDAGDGVTEPIGDLGEVRLRYAGRIRLTDRERLTLRTFASALQTAVRNAAAFTEASRLADRHAHAALHDPLTAVANRRLLLRHGATMLAGPGTTALVILDLNMFREVNETLGLLAGDRLLVEVARRLERSIGPGDLIARLGGDEFAALVGLPSAGVAEARARELLACLDAPVELDGMRIRVEASAGVAVRGPTAPDIDGGEDSVVELMRQADVAMYQAKRGGPQVVRYDSSRDPADVAALLLGGDLPRAIAEREFVVSFQPIVDLASGEMVSAEALARWHHPDRGDLDPRRFLAAVERSGLLPAFAEAVLDQALAAMAQWRGLGIRAPVAVNASPRSLLDPAFPRMVVDRLAAHGASGADLVIELTETLAPSQVDQVSGVLRELRGAGITLALDDFGTGYSSLTMLAKVPVSELKIDRSFVATMHRSREALAVVRTTIELGRSLNRLVVAEGVERPEQREALWELRCPAGQGHLFGRPMPIQALLAALTETEIVGRLAPPLRGAAGNVIELPRPRWAEGSVPGEL